MRKLKWLDKECNGGAKWEETFILQTKKYVH